MKKSILTALMIAATVGSAWAKYTVFINPGHGGHDAANDRNVVIYPYTAGDPNGYWESNSNLDKGLHLRDLLEAQGYKVVMSRVTNTSDDDLPLSTIVAMGNKSGADVYFSIHSNATGTSSRRNAPLMLFRGYDNEPVKPMDKVLCEVLNKQLLENGVTTWTSTALNIRGDFTFYPNWNNAGLGALRGLTVTGMLSEGSFHDYIPETYRLMNTDYNWLEAWHFCKTVEEFLNQPGVDYGVVGGRVNDSRLPREEDFIMFNDDRFETIQGALVELLDANGKVVDTYTTETKHYNGVFMFRKVAPGNYTLRVSEARHETFETPIAVEANKASYAKVKMQLKRDTPPEVTSYAPVWKDGDEPVLCNAPITITFNWDMNTELTEKAFKIDPPAEGTFSWTDANHILTFTPKLPYAINTLYTVTIGTGAQHPSNMGLKEPFVFTFLTSSRDFMSPTGYFPTDGETIHYKDATIEFRFDKIIASGNVLSCLSCYDSQGNEVAFNKRKLKASTVKSPYGFFRVPFLNDLTPGETYNLKISNAIADKDGITLKDPIDIHFTAVDAGAAKTGTTIVDDMDNHEPYVYLPESSAEVASQKVALDQTDKLFGNASTAFTYAFNGTEGGEIMWQRTPAAETTYTGGNHVTLHVNGDLSGNELYLQFTSETDVLTIKATDLDFLGWRYIDIDPALFSDGVTYSFTGIKLQQKSSPISGSGTFKIDDLAKSGTGGVNDILGEDSGISVYPNPASEFIIANAGNVIQSVDLTSLSGAHVAHTQGNILRVSDIANGTYVVTVKTAFGQYISKIIVKH